MKTVKKAVFAIAVAFFAACASIPKKEHEAALALRERLLRYKRVTELAIDSFKPGEQNFNKADSIIAEKRSKEMKQAKQLLLDAIEKYTDAIANGMPAYADELKGEISTLIAKADEMKVRVMEGERFDAAQEKFKTASSQADQGMYDDALGELEAVRDDLQKLFDTISSLHDSSKSEVEQILERREKLEQLVEDIKKEEEKAAKAASKKNKKNVKKRITSNGR